MVATWLALPLVVLCVALGLTSSPDVGESPGCLRAGPDDDHCDRLTRSRSSPGADERATARRVADELERALTMRRIARCSPQCPSGAVPVPRAEEVRAWLAEAGHDTAVVRTATVEDPAPAGSVVYAVRVGSACVVGHHHASDSVARTYVLGTLSGGDCLPRSGERREVDGAHHPVRDRPEAPPRPEP